MRAAQNVLRGEKLEVPTDIRSFWVDFGRWSSGSHTKRLLDFEENEDMDVEKRRMRRRGTLVYALGHAYLAPRRKERSVCTCRLGYTPVFPSIEKR
jgi:hypothetical protein